LATPLSDCDYLWLQRDNVRCYTRLPLSTGDYVNKNCEIGVGLYVQAPAGSARAP